jgi:hypothetical protein
MVPPICCGLKVLGIPSLFCSYREIDQALNFSFHFGLCLELRHGCEDYVFPRRFHTTTCSGFRSVVGSNRISMEGPSASIAITEAGRRAAGDVAPLPTGPSLLAWWRARRPQGEAQILYVLARHYTGGGRPLSREDVAMATDRSPTSGGFGQALANLRRLGLISGSSREIRIADELIG